MNLAQSTPRTTRHTGGISGGISFGETATDKKNGNQQGKSPAAKKGHDGAATEVSHGVFDLKAGTTTGLFSAMSPMFAQVVRPAMSGARCH